MAAVLCSLLLMAVDHRYRHLETVRTALSVVVSPLYYIADLPVSGGRWLTEAFATRERLQREKSDLHQANLRLRGQLQKLESLESENRRLRDLLDSSLKIGDQVLVAELLSVDLDPFRQQVIINRGSHSGVFEGQAVVDADAVMGQVVHVTPFTSTVLMITDPSHALPVQVNRNGLRAVAAGTGRTDELVLSHLPVNADIGEGDLLVTSGLGGRFPPSYPVARVTSVVREPGQPFATVLATPSAHLERVREVLLVRTLSSPLRKADRAAEETPP